MKKKFVDSLNKTKEPVELTYPPIDDLIEEMNFYFKILHGGYTPNIHKNIKKGGETKC